jgi:hypothetical protein
MSIALRSHFKTSQAEIYKIGRDGQIRPKHTKHFDSTQIGREAQKKWGNHLRRCEGVGTVRTFTCPRIQRQQRGMTAPNAAERRPRFQQYADQRGGDRRVRSGVEVLNRSELGCQGFLLLTSPNAGTDERWWAAERWKLNCPRSHGKGLRYPLAPSSGQSLVGGVIFRWRQILVGKTVDCKTCFLVYQHRMTYGDSTQFKKIVHDHVLVYLLLSKKKVYLYYYKLK